MNRKIRVINPCWSDTRHKLNKSLNSPLELALYVAKKNCDNQVGDYIDNFLDKSPDFKIWRQYMPSRTPEIFSEYQNKYPLSEEKLLEVDNYIKNKLSNFSLPVGQVLFHGGTLSLPDKDITTRPLSTTFCPQVALYEAHFRGKAYTERSVNLWVITIKSCNIHAFVYEKNEPPKGHEKEVLLQSGIVLKITNKRLLGNSAVGSSDESFSSEEEYVPTYVIEASAFLRE